MTEVSTYILRFMDSTVVQKTVVCPALFAGSENVVCPIFRPIFRHDSLLDGIAGISG